MKNKHQTLTTQLRNYLLRTLIPTLPPPTITQTLNPHQLQACSSISLKTPLIFFLQIFLKMMDIHQTLTTKITKWLLQTLISMLPSPTTMRIVKNHYQLRDCPPTTSSTLSILPPELTTFHPKNIPNAPHNKHPNSQPTSTSSLFINKPQDTFSFFSSTSFSKNEAQSSNPDNPNQEMLTPNLNCNTPPTKKHPNIKSPSNASLFINQPLDIFDLFSTTNFSKNKEQPSNLYNPTQEQVTPNLKSNTPPTNKHPDIEPTSTASLFINQPQNTFEFFSTSFSKNEGYLSNHDNQNQQMFTLNLKRNALPTNNHPTSKKAPSSASLSPNNPQHSFDITPTLDIQNHETSHPNINPNAPSPPSTPLI